MEDDKNVIKNNYFFIEKKIRLGKKKQAWVNHVLGMQYVHFFCVFFCVCVCVFCMRFSLFLTMVFIFSKELAH